MLLIFKPAWKPYATVCYGWRSLETEQEVGPAGIEPGIRSAYRMDLDRLVEGGGPSYALAFSPSIIFSRVIA